MGVEIALPNNVLVAVRVQDERGAPVLGLGVDDFTVAEDGAELPEDSGVDIVNDRATAYAVHVLFHHSKWMTESYATGWGPKLEQWLKERSAQHVTWFKMSQFTGAEQVRPICGWNSTTTMPANVSLIPSTLPDDAHDPSANLHGAVQDALLEFKYKVDELVPTFYAHRILVVLTDDVDRADRVSADAVATLVQTSGTLIFLLDMAKHVDEHGWARDGVDRIRMADLQKLQMFLLFVDRRIAQLTGNVYVIGYCSPSRERVHTATVRFQDAEMSIAFDAHGFVGMCDRLDLVPPNMQLPVHYALRLPSCQIRRPTTPDHPNTVDDDDKMDPGTVLVIEWGLVILGSTYVLSLCIYVGWEYRHMCFGWKLL